MKLRDDRHYACVDRQAYTATTFLVLGWALSWVLDWVGVPGWGSGLVMVILALVTPAGVLLYDTEERRRSRS